MKFSILAVGTELTSGQITNRNAAWISQRLSNLGLQTEIHVTVSDDRASILEALSILESKSDFIFVSGGLGPTSDDFTRDLITEWSGQAVQFHELSWKKIQDRLQSRGLPVSDFQKQQCYFPHNAQVLDNSEGTANGFYLTKNTKHLWALPGPPNEVAAIWNDHIEIQIQKLTESLDRYMTVSWDALGLGESLAPSLIEPAVKGSGADIGYRVHMPYLEIKLSFFRSQYEKMKPFINQVEESLQKYTVSRNGEDIINSLQKIILKAPHFFVCDEVTQGLLMMRLSNLRKSDYTFTTDQNLVAPLNCWKIHCQFINEFEIQLELTKPDDLPFRRIIQSPYIKSAQMSNRMRQYFSEMILIMTCQHWRVL